MPRTEYFQLGPSFRMQYQKLSYKRNLNIEKYVATMCMLCVSSCDPAYVSFNHLLDVLSFDIT